MLTAKIGNLRLHSHHLAQIAKRQKHVQLLLSRMLHNLGHDASIIGPEALHPPSVQRLDHICDGVRSTSQTQSLLHPSKEAILIVQEAPMLLRRFQNYRH